MPVIGWRTNRGEAGAIGVESSLLGVLISTARGVVWTGTGLRREDYPPAEASPPPPIPAAEIVDRAIEVVHLDEGLLIAIRGNETGRHTARADPTEIGNAGVGRYGARSGLMIDKTGAVDPL
jgi:hypothetical protein